MVERGHNKKSFVLNGEKRQTEENVIHSLLQEARPPSFVEQTLTGAREGSEVREGPIDCTINSQTGGDQHGRNTKRSQKDAQRIP